MSRYTKCLQDIITRKSIVNQSNFKSELSLNIPRQLSRVLNDPYNAYPCIHVTGTNGM